MSLENTLVCGDAVEVMRMLSDASVDLMIAELLLVTEDS